MISGKTPTEIKGNIKKEIENKSEINIIMEMKTKLAM